MLQINEFISSGLERTLASFSSHKPLKKRDKNHLHIRMVQNDQIIVLIFRIQPHV